MNNTDKWLDDVVYKGLAPTASSWIQRAVQQKNERMTVSLACSVLLTYSGLDKVTLQQQKFN